MKKKVIEIYFDKDLQKQHPASTGLILILEDGTKLEQNMCQDNCIEPFTLASQIVPSGT